MSTQNDLPDRVTALERRLAEVEATLSRSGTRPVAPPVDGDALWALAGLLDRNPEGDVVLLAGSVTAPNGQVAHWQMQATTDEYFSSDFAERADTLAALAHPVRLRILQRLLTDCTSVQDLLAAGEFGTSGQVYHHLRQLVSAGWLRAVGNGRYEVQVARIVPLLGILLGVDR